MNNLTASKCATIHCWTSYIVQETSRPTYFFQ